MFYFASDVHLGAGTPQEARRCEARFAAWLDAAGADAEAIFLLGDIFDFWFEYRHVVPQGFVRTLGRLAALTDRGVRVVLVTGNHDMWVGDYLRRECGVEVHTRPLTVALAGRRIFLAHGDDMNVGRRPLLRLMNAMFRSRWLRWCFAWFVHPDWAVRFGRWWSGKSRKRHTDGDGTAAATTEPLAEYARTYGREHPEVDCCIFGHMHRALLRSGRRPEVVHLGCWDDEPVYAVLSDDGRIELKTFTV